VIQEPKLEDSLSQLYPHGIQILTTNTTHFIDHRTKPAHKKATYARIVSEYRAQKSDPYRIRITVGGDQIHFAGETFTPNADIATSKVLFNSVISTPGAKFMTIDIKDFYLSTDMPDFEYMWLPRWIFPPRVHCQLQH